MPAHPFSPPDRALDPNTLVELLRRRALRQPDRLAFTFLGDEDSAEHRITYGELDEKARAIGAWLQSCRFSGTRALLLYAPGLEFISAYFGCLYAGVVAVPTYPPRLNRPLPRLQAIATDSQATVGLTTSSILANMERRFIHTPELEALKWFDTDIVPSGIENSWQEPEITGDTLAFLQYTSGSTTVPKGVMLTHANLLYNLALIRNGFQIDSSAIGVFWLPSFHDMGLVGGILEPIFIEGPSILMSPTSFLQRPARWLEAITRYQATITGAPNFAYEMCVDKISSEQRAGLDLSSLAVAFCGAEPIRLETMKRFAEAFEPFGFRRHAFYPCYGLAEATLLVSGGLGPGLPVTRTVSQQALEQNRVAETADDKNQAKSLVGSGRALLEQRIVIVNPETCTQCPPDQVGEIWVSSPSVGKGYWNRPAETQASFRACLSDTGEGPFLRTGDLGFLANEELFVTGRLKDLIVIRGRNYYPQDIELTIEQSHPGLRRGGGAAFSVEMMGEERLVVVQEIERHHRNPAKDEMLAAIRQAIADNYELQVAAVQLLKPLSIPTTSSGKVQRHLCRAGFLDGTLEVVGEWRAVLEPHSPAPAVPTSPTRRERAMPNAGSPQLAELPSAAEIQDWLVSQVAQRLGIDAAAVDIRQAFSYYGLDSIQAVSLSGDLGTWLGRSVSPTLALDYPTIEILAHHLGEEAAQAFAFPKIKPNFHSEPIAIIGMGCRFPGGANDPEAFWRLLRDGVDAITEVPAERWDVDAYYDPDTEKPGKTYARWGAFLDNVDQFDAQFFGISPREAARMDPQQRLVLEVTWEALADAGQPLFNLAGSQTGVFVGISSSDYTHLQVQHLGPNYIDAYSGTGSSLSVAAGRISYVLGLQGPSLALDTACSSSLVAVHLACQSLRTGESNLAVAGGVNLILSPDTTIYFSKIGVMAHDGRCKTFDAAADGYVRGEGCGMVVLKRLSEALADGDRIHAVVRGSAVNQDGRSNGLTAPNGPAQQAVIRSALANAGVLPSQVGYVEAHGTGTILGDPIEMQALAAVMSAGRSRGQPVVVGSVKTNVGHLEAAAGIAGLLKVVLSLQHREIPRHLHLRQVNPHISLQDMPVLIPTEQMPWISHDEHRVAGVSAFGFSGTNAHVVVEEAPLPVQTARRSLPAPYVLTLSAKSENALLELSRRHLDLFADQAASREVNLQDICYTASLRHTHHDHRLAIVGASREQFAEALSDFGQRQVNPHVFTGRMLSGHPRKIVFVFPGQGSQWLGMGRELLEQEPVFRAALEECDRAMRPYVGWSLLAELKSTSPQTRFDEIDFIQPALFAIQVGLAGLWRSWGIEPQAVVGHSMGELAAAHVAGVLSLEDAARVICLRSRLLKRVSGQGAMAAVDISLEQARVVLRGREDSLSIAVSNSPTSTVLAGDPGALRELMDELQRKDIFCRLVKVDVASHSPAVEPLRVELLQSMQGLSPKPAKVPIYSSVTGRIADASQFDANYWWLNLRQTVLFSNAVNQLVENGHDVFLEISAHPILLAAIRQGITSSDGPVILASLRREQSERETMLASLAALYALGQNVDWRQLYPTGGSCIQLPSYPWQRERFWFQVPEVERHDETEREMEPRARVDSAPWLYELQWQHKARVQRDSAPFRPADGSGNWLILADKGEVGRALATQLEAKGENCLVLNPGEEFQTTSRNLFVMHPESPHDIRQALATVPRTDHPRWRGVIHLRSLDAAPAQATTAASLEEAQELGCGNVLRLVQALTQAEWDPSPPRLWLVTQGAQPVDGSASLEPAQAPLWGMGRTIMQEHPELAVTLVDLDPAAPLADSSRILCDEVWDPDDEDQIAFRHGQRFAARLERKRLSGKQGHQFKWRRDASYLIVGGLGDLGLKVARWMIERGARRLVLMGRRQFPPRGDWSQIDRASCLGKQIAAVLELEAMGASVHLASADVTNEASVTSFLEMFRREGWPPIKGVMHAAGIVKDGLLVEMDTAALNAALRPRVLGGWILDRVFQDASLDFFILFSSFTSLLGQPRAGAYAAAGAFLDALAHYRRGQNRLATSINWGVWGDSGFASSSEGQHLTRNLAQSGIGTLPPDQALDVLGQLVRHDLTQVGVMPIQWDKWGQVNVCPLVADLLREETGTVRSELAPRTLDDLTREVLRGADPSERRSLVESYLRNRIAQVLQINPSKLDIHKPLVSLGMDSLMAAELIMDVETDLNIVVPLVRILRNPSVADFSQQLLELLLVPDVDNVAPPNPTPSSVEAEARQPKPSQAAENITPEKADQLLSRLGEMTEDEIDSLLNTLSREGGDV